MVLRCISKAKNWHLLYTPTDADADGAAEGNVNSGADCRECFLCYIRPVHYNAIRIVV